MQNNEDPHARLPDQPSESDLEWEFVEPHHTKERPPYLKTSNFSPASMSGRIVETLSPETGLETSHREDAEAAFGRKKYPTTSDSGSTDSTVKADASLPVPAHVEFILSCDYDGAAPQLTEQAVRALDSGYPASLYPGNMGNWMQGGLPFGRQQPADLSSSMMMPEEGHPRTATTSGTPSSWDAVIAPATQDLTAAAVCAAGYQFDAPIAPNTYGQSILDEL